MPDAVTHCRVTDEVSESRNPPPVDRLMVTEMTSAWVTHVRVGRKGSVDTPTDVILKGQLHRWGHVHSSVSSAVLLKNDDNVPENALLPEATTA